MSDNQNLGEADDYVVVVTEGPILGYTDGKLDGDAVIVTFRGQTELFDGMVDVTFGVDPQTAEWVLNELYAQRTVHLAAWYLNGEDDGIEPSVIMMIEDWQILTADTEAPL